MQDKAYFLSLQEKEDTVSSQGKQILELHTQLKTSVAALEVSDINTMMGVVIFVGVAKYIAHGCMFHRRKRRHTSVCRRRLMLARYSHDFRNGCAL